LRTVGAIGVFSRSNAERQRFSARLARENGGTTLAKFAGREGEDTMKRILSRLLLVAGLLSFAGAGLAARAVRLTSANRLVKAFEALPARARQRALNQIVRGAKPHDLREASFTGRRYAGFRDGDLGTSILVSGSTHDGLHELATGLIRDGELMRLRQATTPLSPTDVDALVRQSHGEIVTTNVSEQPQIIEDIEQTAVLRNRTGDAKALAIDMVATVNKNAQAVDGDLARGVSVVKVGSLKLSAYEMLKFYEGLGKALGKGGPRGRFNKPLQEVAGIGLIDATRVEDVAFFQHGKPITLERALDLARQGRRLDVVQVAGRALTDVDDLVMQAAEADARNDTAAGTAIRGRINQLSTGGAFHKAQLELLLAHQAGLKTFLFDTQNKASGFNRFKDMYSDRELVQLSDLAHELGMDIWAAGSITPDDFGRIVKAGWNLACFGGSARHESGLRSEGSSGEFEPIKPELVGKLVRVKQEAEATPEARLSQKKAQLLARYHSTAPRVERQRAWQDYQALKTAGSL
jgi:hypothetical protein